MRTVWLTGDIFSIIKVDRILFITGVPAIARLTAMAFIFTTNYDKEISSLGCLMLMLEL